MATYKEIQTYIKNEYGYAAKSCWIAYMKELSGLKPGDSLRRISSTERAFPCTENKQVDIKATFKHFNMI